MCPPYYSLPSSVPEYIYVNLFFSVSPAMIIRWIHTIYTCIYINITLYFLLPQRPISHLFSSLMIIRVLMFAFHYYIFSDMFITIRNQIVVIFIILRMCYRIKVKIACREYLVKFTPKIFSSAYLYTQSMCVNVSFILKVMIQILSQLTLVFYNIILLFYSNFRTCHSSQLCVYKMKDKLLF